MTSLCFLVPLLLAGISFAAPATKHVLEVYFAVDPQVLRNYQTYGYDKHTALKNLKGDVDFIIYQTNQYMKSMERHGLDIEIRPTKIDILKEEIFHSGKLINKNQLQVDTALSLFKKWLEDKRVHAYPGYDVAVVLTGYDGYSSPGKTSVAGYATVEAACHKTNGVALVEFTATQMTAHTLAHELAHSLGSPHDQTSTCSPNDGYVMAPKSSPENKNRWHFSSCTVSHIREYITKLESRNNNCLTLSETTARAPSFSLRSHQGRDILDINDICKRAMQDKDAYFCGYHSFFGGRAPQGDEVCQYIMCAPKKSLTCTYKIPTEGLVCDVGKRCSEGKCVTAPRTFPAPKVQTDCVFGDLLAGDIYGSDNCEAYIAKKGARQCNQKGLQERCCKTCGAQNTGIKGCEYGDKDPSCSSYHRDDVCPNNMDICCEHCNGYYRGKRSAVPAMPALPISNATVIDIAHPTIKEDPVEPEEESMD